MFLKNRFSLPRHCQNCGNIIEQYQPNQKYCSEKYGIKNYCSKEIAKKKKKKIDLIANKLYTLESIKEQSLAMNERILFFLMENKVIIKLHIQILMKLNYNLNVFTQKIIEKDYVYLILNHFCLKIFKNNIAIIQKQKLY